jgi:hypothetical protein
MQLAVYVWEIDHFAIKSDILGRFFNSILKLFLKLTCYHDNTSCLENIIGLSARRGFLHACIF